MNAKTDQKRYTTKTEDIQQKEIYLEKDYYSTQELCDIVTNSWQNYYKEGKNFSSESYARQYLQTTLLGKEEEVFGAIFLNSRFHFLADEILFTGSISNTFIHPRILVKRALYHNALGVILYHNHPSGNSKPSSADTRITKKLGHLLAELDISLLDHFVIGTEVISMQSERLMEHFSKPHAILTGTEYDCS